METILKNLKFLRLSAMAKNLEDQLQNPIHQNLCFEERLELLLHSEITARRNRKIISLLRTSKLKTGIRLEDITSDEHRGLSRGQLLSFMRLDFIAHHQNIIIVGPTGCGKTHLANAIGNKACIEGYSVKFVRLPLFLEELQLGHNDGTFLKIIQQLMQFDVLILDDFGITSIDPLQVHDLLTIFEDRYKTKSTIITAQLPIKSWHSYLGNPTLADAILDRVLSQTAKVELTGKSLRWKDKVSDLPEVINED